MHEMSLLSMLYKLRTSTNMRVMELNQAILCLWKVISSNKKDVVFEETVPQIKKKNSRDTLYKTLSPGLFSKNSKTMSRNKGERGRGGGEWGYTNPPLKFRPESEIQAKRV